MVLDGGPLPRRRPVELPPRTPRRRLEAAGAAAAARAAALRPLRRRRAGRGPDDGRVSARDRRAGRARHRGALRRTDRLGPAVRALRRRPAALHPQLLQALSVGVAGHRPLRAARPRHPGQRRRHRHHLLDRARLEDAALQQGAAGDPLGAQPGPPESAARLPRRPARTRRRAAATSPSRCSAARAPASRSTSRAPRP